MTQQRDTSKPSQAWLAAALGVGDPFPWQRELLRRLLANDCPRALDIPTGLGKTSVMAIWLVARACGAELPRRLVYVVDRRAVVDQATDVAEALRIWVAKERPVADALGLGDRPLPISTLRGQHVDNRRWLEDPSASAIVVGTVDMIGSRLLFEGYQCSRKLRPYHAALLGADALIALDEAHLVPAFGVRQHKTSAPIAAEGRAAAVTWAIDRALPILTALGEGFTSVREKNPVSIERPTIGPTGELTDTSIEAPSDPQNRTSDQPDNAGIGAQVESKPEPSVNDLIKPSKALGGALGSIKPVPPSRRHLRSRSWSSIATNSMYCVRKVHRCALWSSPEHVDSHTMLPASGS